jgi:hypothetical protein
MPSWSLLPQLQQNILFPPKVLNLFSIGKSKKTDLFQRSVLGLKNIPIKKSAYYIIIAMALEKFSTL